MTELLRNFDNADNRDPASDPRILGTPVHQTRPPSYIRVRVFSGGYPLVRPDFHFKN